MADWTHESRAYRVAVKKVVEYNRQSFNDMIDEATVMGQMLHEHLVRLIGISLSDDGLAIVTQYCPDGCLLDYLKRAHHKLTNTIVLQWALQIALVRSLLWVHSHTFPGDGVPGAASVCAPRPGGAQRARQERQPAVRV